MDVIDTAYKLTYKENVELAVQQKRSRFENAFTYHGDLKGRQACFLELIGATEAIIDGNRGGDTPNIDADIEPIWVTPRQIEWGKVIEKEDYIKALTDYQSPFVQNGAAAIVRGRDTVFAASIFGDRKIGEDGTTVAAYDTTDKVVAAATGATTAMNLAKIARAKRYLLAAQVDLDMEELWGALNAQEMEELYNDIVSNATNPMTKGAVLNETLKQVVSVAGVQFQNYEKMADYDANNYTAAIWCKSGMHYGDFDPLKIDVQPNPAKKYRPHPYMENWWGASRGEDVKVIKVITAKVPA